MKSGPQPISWGICIPKIMTDDKDNGDKRHPTGPASIRDKEPFTPNNGNTPLPQIGKQLANGTRHLRGSGKNLNKLFSVLPKRNRDWQIKQKADFAR